MAELLSKYTLSKRRKGREGGNATQADKARYGELANVKFVIARLFAELTLVWPLPLASPGTIKRALIHALTESSFIECRQTQTWRH